jgi:hypothetical protein
MMSLLSSAWTDLVAAAMACARGRSSWGFSRTLEAIFAVTEAFPTEDIRKRALERTGDRSTKVLARSRLKLTRVPFFLESRLGETKRPRSNKEGRAKAERRMYQRDLRNSEQKAKECRGQQEKEIER